MENGRRYALILFVRSFFSFFVFISFFHRRNLSMRLRGENFYRIVLSDKVIFVVHREMNLLKRLLINLVFFRFIIIRQIFLLGNFFFF